MLAKHKLIKNKRGSHFVDEVLGEYGYLSKMRATNMLASLWEKHGFTTDMIQKFKQEEVIELKDFPVVETVRSRKTGKDKKVKVKHPHQYTDTKETIRMRKLVKAYNNQLDFTHVDCDAECLSDEDKTKITNMLSRYKKEPVIRIDLASKNVYRVFNNRSFEQGGRFYGAWWIGCPSELRKYITINGDPTVELDYSGIHIQLLYARKGINYARRKEDPYTLDDGLPDRELNKLILLTAINAETEDDARDAVWDQLRREKKLADYDFKRSKKPIMKKLALLKAKHPDIADDIASGEGIKLQYLDSCIIESLISFGIERKIPILTVHDSVVCQTQRAELIQDKMWEFYADLLNTKFNCNIRYRKYLPHASSIMKVLPKRDYKHPSPIDYLKHDPMYQRYWASPAVITEILKSNDIIKITNDTRSNNCSGECKHETRVSNFRSNHRNFLGAISLKLIEDGTLRIRG